MIDSPALEDDGGSQWPTQPPPPAPARAGYSFDVRLDPVPRVPELRLLGRVRTTRAGQHYLPIHRHHDLELAYLCHGSVRWFAHGRSNFLTAGQIFLTMPTTPHGGGQDTLQPSELLWIQLSLPPDDAPLLGCPPDETRALIDQLRILDGTVIGRSPEVGRILADLLQAVEGGDTPETAVRVRAGVLYLLQQAIDCSHRPQNVSPAILRAVTMMEAELDTRLTVSELARHARLSPSHFQHLFRAEMGIGPADFHLNLRLSESCRALAETDESIVTIAVSLGFSSSQHFATSFKQVFGVSPRDYRLAARKPVDDVGPDGIPWTI